MATRSFIAKKESDSSYTAVYCHWDGYPEGVGETLKNFYSNPQDIQKLLEGGDMSSLGKTLNETVYYTQRGEDPHNKTISNSLNELIKLAHDVNAEYLYVFDKEWSHVKLN
jgi:hypothetical protein